ncbi:hypothetical protein LTR53_011222 [Teratosphaeriaceae sp. CCFEE 6253]|nr:hypothetical protein LTR53_011222 [Teratosphaeriaceae sp. CCFEE 6253]
MPTTIFSFTQCVHFCCTPTPLPATFSGLTPPALRALAQAPIDRHTVSPSLCPTCSIYPQNLLKSLASLTTTVTDMQAALQDSMARYEALGQQYHALPLDARAQSTDLPAAALAHTYFGISVGKADPFLTTARATLVSLGDIRDLLWVDPDQLSEDWVGEIIAQVSETRLSLAVCLAMVLRLESAYVAVEQRGDAYDKCERVSKRDDAVPSRVLVAKTAIAKRWEARMEAIREEEV